MATYTHGADSITAVSGSIIASTAVTLNQVFSPTNGTDDCYRLHIKCQNPVLDSNAGPFGLIPPGGLARGADSVPLLLGDAAKLNAGDTVIIRDPSTGQTYKTYVDSSHTGSSPVPLGERIREEFEPGVTIERAPRIEITGTEGVGSEAGGVSVTETIWMPALTDGIYKSRLKYDPNQTLTISTYDFTKASGFEVVELIEPSGVYRSDRRTARILQTAKNAPVAAVTNNDKPFLSNGSGTQTTTAGAYGLTANSIRRYAEQHPPIRPYVVVNSGTVFNSVTLWGMNIWSPIREAIAAATTNNIRVSPECWSQFVVGDSIAAIELASGGVTVGEVRTIGAKTAPDILTVVGNWTNAYSFDSIVGILQTDVVNVAAGVGTYYSALAFCQLYGHSTPNSGEDFEFEVWQSVQGHCGALHTIDHRKPAQYDANTARQNDGVYQISTPLTYGDGADLTAFGQAGGALVMPRHGVDLLTSGATISDLNFGVINEFGAAVSGCHIVRGASQTSDDIWDIKGSGTNHAFIFGTSVDLNKVSIAADSGRALISNPAFVRMTECAFRSRNVALSNSETDVVRDVTMRIDDAFEAIVGSGSGSSFRIDFPNSTDDYKFIDCANSYARSPVFIPQSTFGDPLQVRALNERAIHAAKRGSDRIALIGASAIDYTARGIDCFFSEVEIGAPGAFQTRTCQSAFSMNLRFINETGDALDNVRAILHRDDGTLVFNILSDSRGMTTEQIVVDLEWSRAGGAAGGPSTYIDVNDDLPDPTSWGKVKYGPFTLLCVPPTNSGYTTTRIKFDVVPFMPEEKKNWTIVMSIPRGERKFYG